MLCIFPKFKVKKYPNLPIFVCSIMSGDSPNAFTNENVFDFREGRSSPGPTTSKDHIQQGGVVTASVLVEPQKEKSKDKEKEKEDEDRPDFSSPTLNPGADKEKQRSDADRPPESNDPKYDDDRKDDKKEEQNLLNGGLDRLPKTDSRPKDYDEESEDDTCIVNCIYYTMECCKCSIM